MDSRFGIARNYEICSNSAKKRKHEKAHEDTRDFLCQLRESITDDQVILKEGIINIVCMLYIRPETFTALWDMMFCVLIPEDRYLLCYVLQSPGRLQACTDRDGTCLRNFIM